MPLSDSTAPSVVPPPISTTIAPRGSATCNPAPIAAASDSSMNCTDAAPALLAASRIARRSTIVDPDGTQITTWLRWTKRLAPPRSEEHTSELQSLMRISYAVFCLKEKKTDRNRTHNTHYIHYIHK